MIVALTGTPGTGKTAISNVLRERKNEVLDLGTYIKSGVVARKRANSLPVVTGRDDERNSLIVDERRLREAVKPILLAHRGTLFVDGHLSHHLSPLDMIVVLRCKPSELGKRLLARGYAEEKIRENVEAEAVDAITIEVAQLRTRNLLACEIDTTERAASEVAIEIESLAKNPTPEALNARKLGACDWSSEVLSWY